MNGIVAPAPQEHRFLKTPLEAAVIPCSFVRTAACPERALAETHGQLLRAADRQASQLQSAKGPSAEAAGACLQPKAGVDTGPLKLVEAGLVSDIEALGYAVTVEGLDLPVVAAAEDPDIGKLKKPRLVSKTNQVVAQAVGKHAKAGRIAGARSGLQPVETWS